MDRTYFDVLGVPRAYHVPLAQLEAQYLALSRQLHPDRFAKAPPRERMGALQKTTELNDAYRVLKNDVKRAEYLLKLEGLDLSDERSSIQAAPALLMEMMELNEALDEARAAGAHARVQALVDDIQGRQAAAMTTLGEAFARFETGDRAALDTLAQTLIAMRYQARFLEHAEPDEAQGAL